MVDFNKETTVTTPAINLVKLLILEARYNALTALEIYNNKISQGVSYEQSIIRARLGTWLLEHEAYILRQGTKDDKENYTSYRDVLFFKQQKLTDVIILDIVKFLNNIIDKLRITRIDTRPQYDTTDIEADNDMQGYA